MRRADEIIVLPAVVANFDTNPIQMEQMTFFSAQLAFQNGTLTGTCTLQSSNDLVNWDTVTNSSQAIAAPGSHTYEMYDACSHWYRIHFVYGAGTSDITITTHNKGNS